MRVKVSRLVIAFPVTRVSCSLSSLEVGHTYAQQYVADLVGDYQICFAFALGTAYVHDHGRSSHPRP